MVEEEDDNIQKVYKKDEKRKSKKPDLGRSSFI